MGYRSLIGGGLTAAALTGAGALLCPATLAAQAPTVTDPAATTPSESPASTTPSSTGTTTTPTTTGATPTTTTPTSTQTITQTSPQTTTSTSTQTTTTPSKAPHTSASKPPKALVQHSQGTTTTPTQTTTAVVPVPAAKAPAAPTSSAAIAPAPQLAVVQSGALAAMMSGSAASLQALSFYRIPLFLLPIYQAAAVQYGVPWQVLAAINEVETNFGTDLSVSTAGAVGWMQFMPETWLQYGVDAVGAGYADPYNPVDAIFAAARYLHAAGASSNLRGAILAYNHSEAYAESVLLRARLFASYPSSAIATLTGLTEGSLPVAGARIAPGSPIPSAQGPSPAATPGSSPAPSPQASATAASSGTSTPGSTSAPTPAANAAAAARILNAAAPPSQLSELLGRKRAPVLAVEDGRIVGIGVSRKIGGYLVLRDTYGDVFTYAGLGDLAPAYRLAKPAPLQVPKGALPSGEAGPAPTQAASAGSQSPVTLHVAARKPAAATAQVTSGQQGAGAQAPGGGKVRVFAHPGNPDALAAKRLHEQTAREKALAAGWAVLQSGSVVSQGTVLGHLGAGSEGKDASLRFAIRPAGAQSAVDPRPILENWRQLSSALHPRGSNAGAVLAGATAADAFQLSPGALERAVLADPGIALGACDRSQVAAGRVDPNALALLVFLSRSGLKPTVGQLRCGSALATASGVHTVFPAPGTLDIAAINGVPIAGHQGAGTATDVTIRTLLTVKRRYAPKRIVSLMSYPGAPSTVAEGDHSTFIQLEFPIRTATGAVAASVAAHTAGATGAGRATATHAGGVLSLDTFEWQRLIDQIASIQQPKVAYAPSASAIRDENAPGSGGSTRTLP
ncbi:MAG TPA: lytic murein transglycosylase [Solirubrobacteraceae bacterium]|jgi:membrane-bound lytic murein transglycosylase B|nr:lytic murein transglycosylase [Solirubrobacteraceae bacterium]